MPDLKRRWTRSNAGPIGLGGVAASRAYYGGVSVANNITGVNYLRVALYSPL